MTTWDYRVVRKAHDVAGEKWENFRVVEVYYNDDGEQRGWVEDIRPYGETLNELHVDLQKMMAAFEKPVLNQGDLR